LFSNYCNTRKFIFFATTFLRPKFKMYVLRDDRLGMLTRCLDVEASQSVSPGHAESPVLPSPIRVRRVPSWLSVPDSDSTSNQSPSSQSSPARHPIEYKSTERFLAADLLRRVQAAQGAALPDEDIKANCQCCRGWRRLASSSEDDQRTQLTRALRKLLSGDKDHVGEARVSAVPRRHSVLSMCIALRV